MKLQLKLFLVLFVATSLFAEVQDKFKINLGTMFITNFETELQIGREGLPLAARINTKDQLNMKTDTSTIRLDGYYRFTEKQSVEFAYFRAHSKGNRAINEDIEFGDDGTGKPNIISAGASVDSYLNMDVYEASYIYSFYHNKDVELAISLGLHITDIKLGLSASGTINGTPSETYRTSAGITAPLPVIGFKGEYTMIDKRLFLQYKAQYFALKVGDYTGSLQTVTLNLEYRFLDNYGVGMGYNVNTIDIEGDDGNQRFEVKNTLAGALLYLTYVY